MREDRALRLGVRREDVRQARRYTGLIEALDRGAGQDVELDDVGQDDGLGLDRINQR
jgi:hypothetical protein